MAFPLRALMGELAYRTVEIPVGRPVRLRRTDPPRAKTARVLPVVPGRGQPLIYLQPVAASGLVTLALVMAVMLTSRSSRAASGDALAAQVTDTPAAELAALSVPAEDPPREPVLSPPRDPEPAALAGLAGPPGRPIDAGPPRGEGSAKPPVLRASQDADASPSQPAARIPHLLIELAEKGMPAAVLEPARKCSGDYGTALQFARNPVEAAKSAKRDDKLVFLLHVSGNFEDDDFT
jgi:hypothetical protein